MEGKHEPPQTPHLTGEYRTYMSTGTGEGVIHLYPLLTVLSFRPTESSGMGVPADDVDKLPNLGTRKQAMMMCIK